MPRPQVSLPKPARKAQKQHPNAEKHRQTEGIADKASHPGKAGQRDIDDFLEMHADNVVLHVPGENPNSGDYQGREGLMEFLGKVDEATGGTYQAEVLDVMASDEYTVGLDRLKARRPDGRELDTLVAPILRWEDGKIVEAWHMAFDLYAMDEFFSENGG